MPDRAYAAALDRYRAMIATADGITQKGKANPYTSMNGNMFSFLDKDGSICLRLPAGERTAFMAEHKTGSVERYGAVMTEYVAVPETLSDADLAAYFARAVAYAETLKPKKTTRK